MTEREQKPIVDVVERTTFWGVTSQFVVDKIIPYIPLSLVDIYRAEIRAAEEVPNVNSSFDVHYRERSGTTISKPTYDLHEKIVDQFALSGWDNQTPIPIRGEKPYRITFEGSDKTFWIFKKQLPYFTNLEKPYFIKNFNIRLKQSPNLIIYKDGKITLVGTITKQGTIFSEKNLTEDLFSYIADLCESESVDLKIEQVVPKKLQSLLLSLRGLESAGLATLSFINNPGILPKIAGSLSALYSALCIIYENGVDNDINELQKRISAQSKLLK
jgi:hypothetical protein